LCWAVLLFLGACAVLPELKVSYVLPPSGGNPAPYTVVLRVEDARADKTILGPDARRKLAYFSGLLTLSVANPEGASERIGPLPVTAVLETVMGRRLEAMGVEVRSEAGWPSLQLVVRLTDFVLERESPRWIATLAFDARVEQEGRVRAVQTVRGEAERVGLSGTGAADAVLGEIFTDLVNQLDLRGLLEAVAVVRT